jgi:hypothetical protein
LKGGRQGKGIDSGTEIGDRKKSGRKEAGEERDERARRGKGIKAGF